MSRTLTLIHAAWESTQRLIRCGRRRDGLDQVRKLLSLADIPGEIAAEAHRLAGELLIEQERYGESRRHLRASAALNDSSSRTHYLLGLAFERDPRGDDLRAARRFRKASRLEPANAMYRAAFGRAAVRCDRVKTGVRELIAAGESAEGIAVLRIVVDGLIEADRAPEALRVLDKVRFRLAKLPSLSTLRERVRFEMARTGQRRLSSRQDALLARDGAFALLPFIRIANAKEGGKPASAGTIRLDTISFPRPHLARTGSSNADR